MVLKSSILLASSLAFVASSPLRLRESQTTLTTDILTTISPATASCDGADFPEECADASRAVDPINNSFEKYQITTSGEQAALVALMIYESDSFKYNKNHFPGNPGQGTKNMQSPAYNLQYAQSLFDAQTVSAAEAQGPEAILALVSGDEETFGSAAWFLSSQCSDSVRQGLAAATAEGWKSYLVDCIGTEDNEDRDAIWTAATAAMGY